MFPQVLGTVPLAETAVAVQIGFLHLYTTG
jgi:hypothetical protein